VVVGQKRHGTGTQTLDPGPCDPVGPYALLVCVTAILNTEGGEHTTRLERTSRDKGEDSRTSLGKAWGATSHFLPRYSERYLSSHRPQIGHGFGGSGRHPSPGLAVIVTGTSQLTLMITSNGRGDFVSGSRTASRQQPMLCWDALRTRDCSICGRRKGFKSGRDPDEACRSTALSSRTEGALASVSIFNLTRSRATSDSKG
jgi:hypothetical protein